MEDIGKENQMKFTQDKERIIRIIEELILEFNRKYGVKITDIKIEYNEELHYLEELELEIKG